MVPRKNPAELPPVDSLIDTQRSRPIPAVADIPDATLLQRHRDKGDEDAFTILYQRYHNELLGFIRNRLVNQPDNSPEDILQQVFARLLTVPPLPPGNMIRALLYMYARNMISLYMEAVRAQYRGGIGRHRTLTPWTKHTLDEIDPTEASNKAARERTRILIYDLIDGLPPTEATAVRLVWLQGHTAAEAGAILDWPASLVRWRIRRAFHHMREMLDAA